MKARNDSGKDLTLTIMDEPISWKTGSVVELTEKQWSLIMGTTEMERESARMYWKAQFPDALPHLIPLRGRSVSSTPDVKEE
jgi:hypothetical protein